MSRPAIFYRVASVCLHATHDTSWVPATPTPSRRTSSTASRSLRTRRRSRCSHRHGKISANIDRCLTKRSPFRKFAYDNLNKQIRSKMPLRFLHPVHRATHRIGLYLDKLDEPALTQGEAHILAMLTHSGLAKVAELHRGLAHERSTLTGILDRLAKGT